MIEQTVKDRIQTCYQICALIDANSTDNRTLPLKDMLRIEFLKFSSYLVDLDGTIDQEELNCIRDYLQFDLTSGALKNFKENEGVRSDFLKQPPVILKHFVLADAKKMIANDPYEHQAAQILTDTYKIYGQMLISCHATEQTDSRSVETLTNYITLLENFLKEYGVWKYSSDRLFPVTDISSTPTDTPDLSDEETVEALLEELNQLTGLTQVKEEVNRLVNLIRVQKLRAERGFKNSSSSLHMVFSGNPGTGKTTVARILGKIFKQLAVLPSGQLVEVDRSSLVSGYVGQTATKTKEMIDKAMGGILFIDEAYSLTVNKGENDFGQEAVDTLLKAMEDHRDELLVIVAGYPEPMKEFLSSNPGLESRFNRFINFEDYTGDELLQILETQCQMQEYHLSADAKIAAKTYFEERTNNKPENYANARDVRNYLEIAIANHASRVVSLDATDEILTCIEKEDLPSNH